ncbi:DUF5668 domain-containing protein [Caldibacillus lycopersici]|uniref:DUF5668 domain-containing protein n=1 Tax=Perspicuibacillus lycopersici TaxID=1325689 RepID=A0AAE3IXX1_9BACI|nr:DUF5668 domain-containing protein [Perspicuibacillus lycopersici]MCU9614040.1 DUF5668 domain-containing protein [Perspicuibacillus lycopersici]
MKGQHLFPSVILIGFGLYFFLSSLDIHFSFPIFTWPTMLIIIGLAFIFHAYRGKSYESIIPGILFTGLGIHFHLTSYWNIHFDHIGVIILFVALGYLLQYQKTKAGLFYGVLFLILALLQLFYDRLFQWLGSIESTVAELHSFWPVILVLSGIYIFFFKRK